ncbi:ABC transporter substrate-binding protein [Campylobacter canadensis]|uniref:ABC transporter substrate-binding protein n=1 Tax=Campylobacter canadensis TaxID=449520 RepID=UPI001552D0C2|nr:ABC transporter substrate-binding protein [Campylobacter canadensis]MBZ7994096.1 ABC transporter substrate-binding protein [Campylobacter canadensis]MBZ7995901.1 ABC transporter substrate-binding protein [Campylobacter canadensis]MBZ7999427.1 ABC transporter substrate-binding protein [Campylobacter canadensis]MBZ8001224.1 ABC transporter substrate-binding protein [Campylobacter canadensis]MBZ8003753.1 ABC transporter substrate-binding protein [Campylobacter canadensis]
MKFLKILLFIFLSTNLFAKIVEVEDVLGNKVQINTPVKKMVLGFYYTDYLAVGGKDAFKNVIGFSRAVWESWSPISWNMYLEKMPELDKISDFGEVEAGSVAVEKILALEPEVLVLGLWQYEAIKDTLAPIKEANIPIIVVDYHKGDLKNHELSTKIFGILSSNEARANEIWQDYIKRVNLIQERTKNIKEKAKVFIEYGINGPKDNGATYSHYMWGALIDKANAQSIADGLVKTWGPINPESVLLKDPDVIIIAGRESELTKNNYSMVMGNKIKKDEANKRLQGFKNRAGWDELKAIKNGSLYGGYHSMLRTLSDVFMLEFIAKAAYPDLFSDIDPLNDYLEFNKKYLPIVPDGTFMFKAY